MWLRLRQIALVAAGLGPAVDDLRAVLGLDVCFTDPLVATFGLENALLPVGDQFLEVVAPVQQGTAAGRYLERRGGDGGYMVITQCDDHAPRRARAAQLGVREAWAMETPEYRCMQLHPADTGGSFFEIDEQVGLAAHDHGGPWAPAGGGGWQHARRLDRVSAITAAEIQADDPAAVAARWASIAELPVTTAAGGHPAVALENATLRFVPVSDGRGEGLAGLDLACTDAAAVLAAAAEHGLPVRGDEILLCGMRMTLS